MVDFKFSKAAVILGSVAVLAAGCGGSKGNQANPSPAAKTYRAQLSAVNPNVAASAAGFATLTQDGSTLKAEMNATGVEANTQHPTRIHVGTRCPNMEADVNHDSVVDAAEATAAYGEVLADLTVAGNTAPVADAKGNLSYSGIAPASALATSGTMAVANGNVDLSNKVIVIEGVSEGAAIPARVERSNLPVACGVLMLADPNDTTGQAQAQAQAQAQQAQAQQAQQQQQQKQQAQQQQKQTAQQPKEQPKQQPKQQAKDQPKQTQQAKQAQAQQQQQQAQQPKEQPKQTQTASKGQPK